MNTSNNELQNRMSAIKDETQDNQNTARKIGQMLIDFLDSTIIKGKDESQNPSNSQPNLWFLTQEDIFKMVLDMILRDNYLQRNMFYFTEDGTTELSSSITKIERPATSEGELQEKSSKTTISPEENKMAIVASRFVAGRLRKNTCETTVGTSEENYFQVEISHKYTYDENTGIYSVIEKFSNFRVLSDRLLFLINGQTGLDVNAEGIFQNPLLPPQFSQDGWVAPYQHVKDRVIRVLRTPTIKLDCGFYNSTMFHLDFVVGQDEIIIENLANGAEIIVFFKMIAEVGEIVFSGDFFSYFNIPSLPNLVVTNGINGSSGSIVNNGLNQRTFKLNGKYIENYPEGKTAILWEVFEFPNP